MSKLMDYCDGLQHIGIPTEDLKATKDFYEGLGFSTALEAVVPGDQHIDFLQFGNILLECYEEPAVGKAGAINHISINCQDIEAAFAFVQEKGYKVLSNGIERLPLWEKGVAYFIIEGPNKERLELNQKF